MFPLWRRSPVDISPVDVSTDGRVLKEGVEFGSVVVCHVEEMLEHLDSGVLFFEELDDHLSFPLVSGGGVRR